MSQVSNRPEFQVSQRIEPAFFNTALIVSVRNCNQAILVGMGRVWTRTRKTRTRATFWQTRQTRETRRLKTSLARMGKDSKIVTFDQ